MPEAASLRARRLRTAGAGPEQHCNGKRDDRAEANPPREFHHRQPTGLRVQITAEQAEKFRLDGAIGSHLEVLERNDGYKGFNQTGINEIIARTDPRNAQAT